LLPGRTKSTCRSRYKRIQKKIRKACSADGKKCRRYRQKTIESIPTDIFGFLTCSDSDEAENTVIVAEAIFEDLHKYFISPENEVFLDIHAVDIRERQETLHCDLFDFVLGGLWQQSYEQQSYETWKTTMESAMLSGLSDDALLGVLLTTCECLIVRANK
jgi:hypothetical protein